MALHANMEDTKMKSRDKHVSATDLLAFQINTED